MALPKSYEPTNMGPVPGKRRPAPMAYAGWFGHGMMIREGDKIVLEPERPDAYRDEWARLSAALLAVHSWATSAVVRDPSGRAVAGSIR